MKYLAIFTWPRGHQKIGFDEHNFIFSSRDIYHKYIHKWLILNSCLLYILSQNPLSSCSERSASAQEDTGESLSISRRLILQRVSRQLQEPSNTPGSVGRLS